MSDRFDARDYEPMLIGKSAEAFDSEDYLYEIKWDGTRCLAYCDKQTQLINKRARLLNDQFPELQSLFRAMPRKAVLDGEIVVFHEGKPDFYALQRREMIRNPFRIKMAMEQDPAVFLAFDLLYYNGKDLTAEPLSVRKDKLSVFKNQECAALSQTYADHGIQLYEWTVQQGLEGIVAKEKSGIYQCGKRTTSWIKIKNLKDEDFAVCGYLEKERGVLSLVLGQYRGKQLIYKGHVTLGVSASLLRRELPLSSACPFAAEPPQHQAAVWLKPQLVCTVRYMDKTESGSLRQPVLKGFREDKTAGDCVEGQ